MNNERTGSSTAHDIAIAGTHGLLPPDPRSDESFERFDSALEQIFEASQETSFSRAINANPLIEQIRRAYTLLLSGDTTDAKSTLERALASADCESLSGKAQFSAQPFTQRSSAINLAEHSDEWSRTTRKRQAGHILVKTLGTFQVIVNGKNINLNKKPPYRLLSLLKLLIANGGCAVSQSAMIDVLWPDLEGDRARDAQQIALHRLRTLLGSREALLVTLGSVSLNVQFVWVDAFFFETLCRDSFAGGNQQRARVALDLYRGPFLPEETDSPWTARMRNCLRAKFVNIIATAAGELAAQKDFAGAAALYEEAIVINDLENLLHHGLLRSLRQVAPPFPPRLKRTSGLDRVASRRGSRKELTDRSIGVILQTCASLAGPRHPTISPSTPT